MSRRLLLLALLFAADPSFAAEPDFNREVLPVFRKYCNGCHNGRDKEGGLVLEDFARAMQGGEHGVAVTAGNSAHSKLWQVLQPKGEPKMPPEDAPQPKPAEIAIIKAWIDAGAKPPVGGLAATGLVTPKIEPTGKVRSPITALAAAPSGNWLAIARPDAVEIVSLPDRQPIQTLTGHTGAIADVQVSPSGDRLVVAAGEIGLSGEATVWNTTNWTRVTTITGHQDSLYSAVFSREGESLLLATASYDRTIRLWDPQTGAAKRTLAGHNDAVYSVAFHPAFPLLASASGDRTVKLWNTATGERLDTLIQPAKEQYSVAISPDGKFIAAGGVDCRVRVWEITQDGKEGTNPILYARFAHEAPILRVLFSPKGDLLVSCSEERRIKIWETKTFTQVALLERQADWPSAVGFTPDGKTLLVGRMNGDLASYPIDPKWADSVTELVPLSETPASTNDLKSPMTAELAEVEPNDVPSNAQTLTLPAQITGKFQNAGGVSDPDLYRFSSKAGQTWILETNAARNKSAADTKLEVLHADGRPVQRAVLQAVRDSWINFRPIDSTQLQVRVEFWEEMDLNQFLYMNGEIGKFFRAPRGPDSGYDFYDNGGKRRTYFDTTAIAHAKDELVYIVEAYPPTANLVENGLPIFPLYYVNDDDGERELGSDSRLTFTAQSDGEYLVRVTDSRGFQGDGYTYQLTVRPPQPDFVVKVDTKNVKVPAGSGQRLKFSVDRIDNFHDAIRIDVANLPSGYHVATPTVIEAGHLSATSVITAAADAEPASKEAWDAVTVTATGVGQSDESAKHVGSLGEVKLEKAPQIRVILVPDDLSVTASDGGLVLSPGKTITAMIRVERNGFDGDVKFDVDNLPHGVIVDNIGLSGVLVRANETERQIFLTARPWVPDSSRWINAVAQVQGNQASAAMRLHVRGRREVAERR